MKKVRVKYTLKGKVSDSNGTMAKIFEGADYRDMPLDKSVMIEQSLTQAMNEHKGRMLAAGIEHAESKA